MILMIDGRARLDMHERSPHRPCGRTHVLRPTAPLLGHMRARKRTHIAHAGGQACLVGILKALLLPGLGTRAAHRLGGCEKEFC